MTAIDRLRLRICEFFIRQAITVMPSEFHDVWWWHYCQAREKVWKWENR